MEAVIAERIKAALNPEGLEVVCTDASSGKFSVTVVSAAFEGKGLLQRHRAVNSAVQMSDPETAEKIHALEINAKAPGE